MMTDHYTHFDTRQFTEIREVQTKLLGAEPEKKTGGKKQKAITKRAKAGRKKPAA
jgi:hypothetical protein